MDIKILLLLLLLVPGVMALDIDVSIEEKIDGHMAWLNVSSNSPQKFSVTWENIGTMACMTRARADFYNGTRKEHISWGEEVVMRPGESHTWNLYSYLDPGQYNYTIIINHCNERFEFGPYPLVVMNITRIEGHLEIVNSNADDNCVEISVRSDRDLKNIVIIPKDYPNNWVFETGMIEGISAGETRSVRLAYTPIDWEGEAISFVAATEDGNYFQQRPIILRRQESSWDKVILVLILVGALVIYLYYKKTNFVIWKR